MERRAFLTRTDRAGLIEPLALSDSFISFPFGELGDLGALSGDKEALKGRFAEAFPDMTVDAVRQYARQFRTFAEDIRIGDIVAMPSTLQRDVIYVGVVVGEYEFVEDNPSKARHLRRVRWEPSPTTGQALGDDLVRSLRAWNTVSAIHANNAADRLLVAAQSP